MDNWRLDHLLSLQEKDPNDEFILFALAQEYAKIEDFSTAISYYEKLKQINRSYVGLYYHLAKCHIALENYDLALNIYDEGIEVAKNISDHHALSELMNAKLNFELEL